MELGVEKEKQSMNGKSMVELLESEGKIGFNEITELWTLAGLLITHPMQPGTGTSLKDVFSYSNDSIMVQKSSEEFKQWTEISPFIVFCFCFVLKIGR